MSFRSMNLCPAILRALEELSFGDPTLVQSQAIPPAMEGKDVLATARTGSGKTAAYVLPMLQRWFDSGQHTKCLVLVPTRELALQVSEVFSQLTKHLPKFKAVPLYGGVSINPQLMALRGGADAVIATPGRLLDVVDHNGLDLWSTSTLVLDEADRMLDQGFAEELEAVLCELPDNCQTLMFSATLSAKVERFAKTLLDKPIRIKADEPVHNIVQRAIEVDSSRRTELLQHLLNEYSQRRALVFCSSKKSADTLARSLQAQGLSVEALFGELGQQKRERVLDALKQKKLDVLVATDLASRGLDVEALPIVVNFDLPRSTEVYTHRIGRTGRAGNNGIAISFIDADSQAHFKLIEKRVGIKLDREQIPGFEPKDIPVPRLLVGDDNGGIKGKRLSKKDKLRAAAAAAEKANGAKPWE